MIFKMLIGLPASGKSSYTKTQTGFVSVSSDDIRKEFGFAENEKNQTFFIMDTRVLNALAGGQNVVYDATKLGRTRRINFLKSIDRVAPGCKKIAVLFVVPLEVCMERNARRDRHVPEYIYDNMVRAFELPLLTEGFDEIEVVFNGFENNTKIVRPEDLCDFAQENHHHTRTLGDHMLEAYRLMPHDDKDMAEAMYWHDIGKWITKKFENAYGVPTIEAHYQNHDNAGAYLYLVYRHAQDPSIPTQRLLHIAKLINWHMAPYHRWKDEVRKKKDIALLGEEDYKKILIMHEVDTQAH